MQGADLTKRILTKRRDDIAKALIIQKGASLPRSQSEAGRLGRIVDPLSQSLAEGAAHLTVSGIRLLVNIDLPADAAIMTATVGNALKFRIICRNPCFHSSFSSHF
jgi:hypothetical protein